MSRAFVFPGQGSQTPGMGRELAEAFPAVRHLFQEIDDALRHGRVGAGTDGSGPATADAPAEIGGTVIATGAPLSSAAGDAMTRRQILPGHGFSV